MDIDFYGQKTHLNIKGPDCIIKLPVIRHISFAAMKAPNRCLSFAQGMIILFSHRFTVHWAKQLFEQHFWFTQSFPVINKRSSRQTVGPYSITIARLSRLYVVENDRCNVFKLQSTKRTDIYKCFLLSPCCTFPFLRRIHLSWVGYNSLGGREGKG